MADKKIVAHPKVLQKLKWDVKAQGWAITVSEVELIVENKKEKLQKKLLSHSKQLKRKIVSKELRTDY